MRRLTVLLLLPVLLAGCNETGNAGLGDVITRDEAPRHAGRHSTVAGRVVSSAKVLASLCPQPQHLEITADAEPLDLSAGCRLNVLSTDAEPLANAVDRLRSELKSLRNVEPTDQAAVTIRIGAAAEWQEQSPDDALLNGLPDLPEEGYLLDVSANGVSVIGRDVRGAVYGTETLIQLLRAHPRVPALQIRDYPDTAMRISYVGGGHKLTDRVRRIARLAVHYKLNMLVVEDNLYYHLDDPEVARNLAEVFDHFRSMGIEPVPELQSFGWGHSILGVDAQCVEAVPWRDRPFKFGPGGLAEPVGPKASILEIANPGFEQAEGHNLAGWQQDDVRQTVFSDDRDGAGQCLRISRETPGMSRAYQSVSCLPNRDYVLEADMKTRAGEDLAAYFEVYAGPRQLARLSSVSTTTDWQTRRLGFGSGDNTSLTVYLRIQQGTGTAWFDNVSCKSIPTTPMINVVRTGEQPILVKDTKNPQVRFKEGVDYEIIPGDLRFPFVAEARPWQIRLNPAGGIEPGGEVLITYHWAPPGSITYCPSDPRTLAIMKRAIQQTIRLLKPRFMHIGHDEPRIVNVDARCRGRGLAAHELFADDVRRIHGYAKQADPNVRLMMWADALKVRDDGSVQIAWRSAERTTLQEAARDIPKDIVMCTWEYGSEDADVLHRWMTTRTAAGYQVTGSPWYKSLNTFMWGKAIRRLRAEAPGRCLGMFLTTWEDRWNALPLSADLMWTLSSPTLEGTGKQAERALEARYAGFDRFSPLK